MLIMLKRNSFEEYIETELNVDVLDELAAEYMRKRREAIKELLDCLEQLKDLLNGYSPYGRIPPKDRPD
jgi:uncharacterized protein Yka (UPF0111/DUF47 family)